MSKRGSDQLKASGTDQRLWYARKAVEHGAGLRSHWWIFSPSSNGGKREPHDELVNNGNYCLAKPGEIYAVYL